MGWPAGIIAKDIDIPFSGDMLRDAVKSETETGLKAASIMEEGKLVSDEIVINIIKDRICNSDCKNGFILDGFPRTVSQAQELDFMLTTENMKVDLVVDFSVNDEALSQELKEGSHVGLERVTMITLNFLLKKEYVMNVEVVIL